MTHMQCLLLHETDPRGVKFHDESYHETLGMIEYNMTCCSWKEGCNWVPMEREFTFPSVGTRAAIHHVVRVTVDQPSRYLLVDWNVGQFMESSLKGALLFCPM